jgi:hypothetical protein
MNIAVITIGPIAALLAAYVGLVIDGTLTPPDPEAIARSVGFSTATAASVIFVVTLAVIVLMAAIAPIIYAIRANDITTVLISQISALILYLANITLSAVVFASHKIGSKV